MGYKTPTNTLYLPMYLPKTYENLLVVRMNRKQRKGIGERAYMNDQTTRGVTYHVYKTKARLDGGIIYMSNRQGGHL